MQKINFQDLPSTTTPLNAANLNAIQTNAESAINSVEDIAVNGTSYATCTFASNKYTCDIVDSLSANDIVQVFVPFSSQNDSTDTDVSISVNGGDNYYNIKDQALVKNLKASNFSYKDMYLKLLYNGTNFIVLSPNIEQFSYTVFVLSSSQSISSGSFTKINYANTPVDNQGIEIATISSGTITIKQKGKYLFIMNTIYDTNATGGRYQDIFDGGAGYAVASSTGATGVRTALNSSSIISLNVNDTLYCRAYQTSGSSLNLIGGSRVIIIKIG